MHFTGGSCAIGDEISPSFGCKGLGVQSNGAVDIHMKQFFPTWTRLAASAKVGDRAIWLQKPVNWQVGQAIIVTTSAYRDEPTNHQNEERRIVAVNGSVIVLDQPLTFFHYAGVEYQAEVALLSRRFMINGYGSANAGFGGHIMIMGEGRISGVELYDMGQLNQMARYPLHFHRAGERPTSYFSDNSVIKSNFRCYVIHGTNQAKVMRNT